jgi:hypothetical protein
MRFLVRFSDPVTKLFNFEVDVYGKEEDAEELAAAVTDHMGLDAVVMLWLPHMMAPKLLHEFYA